MKYKELNMRKLLTWIGSLHIILKEVSTRRIILQTHLKQTKKWRLLSIFRVHTIISATVIFEISKSQANYNIVLWKNEIRKLHQQIVIPNALSQELSVNIVIKGYCAFASSILTESYVFHVLKEEPHLRHTM